MLHVITKIRAGLTKETELKCPDNYWRTGGETTFRKGQGNV